MITINGKDSLYSLSEREFFLQEIKERVSFLDSSHVLLVTCDRVEVYSGSGEVKREVAEHLYRVVSGLESPLLGETAIQNQVKKAYAEAKEKRVLSKELHGLFQRALKVGKKVRSLTAISRGAMSHGLASIEVLKKEDITLKGATIVIVGVNKISETIIEKLISLGCEMTLIGNRTYSKACELAKKTGAKAFKIKDLYDNLSKADIVVSTTSAPHLIVHKERFISKKKQIIIDLAVPRDIDPAIGDIEDVTLYNVEEVERIINSNYEKRLDEARIAEEIIQKDLDKSYADRGAVCI